VINHTIVAFKDSASWDEPWLAVTLPVALQQDSVWPAALPLGGAWRREATVSSP
jgi:hypothetical protein